MRKSLPIVAATILLALGTGCMSESKYRQLELDWRNTKDQLAERDARIAEMEALLKQLREGPEHDKAMILALTEENDKLRASLTELEKQLADLANRGPGSPLNPETDAALKEFAAAHPDLVEYDSVRGMLKLRSDFTFDSGSADLRSDARSSLGELASILNSPAASAYEIRIVGHTDSVRISQAGTAAKHPTNWHLSAHRAISVRDALDRSGVRPLRMMVGGYSMYRPVVANTKTGAEPNRRVEIYLVRMTPVNESFLGEDGAAAPPPPAPDTTDADDRIPQK